MNRSLAMPLFPPPSPGGPQVVLVTGASSGIGRASAVQLARRGATVVLVARGRPALEEAAAEVRDAGAAEAVVCPADVTDADGLRAVVDTTVKRFGRLDVVVHAAQVMAYGRVEDVPREVFERVVDTALHGTANLARAVLPVFRRQEAGSLVVVSSLLASVATPLMGSYITAKWGQLGLVRTLQQEVRDVPGISVSAVAPGGVSTPIYAQGASYMGSTGRPPPPVYTAERVARAVVGAVDRPRRLVQSGVLNPVVTAGFRLLPAVYDVLVGPLMRLAAVARDDVGPTEGNVFASRPEGNATNGRWRGI
jgi:NAD(P)-dependent dehydrogenase (short-subunit alcohol dehydrogenase family)